ncbi:hypothetical protein EON66_02890 [archaeon]|nr:MAG: hypothetical protein EON66_02890 [archaeon]
MQHPLHTLVSCPHCAQVVNALRAAGFAVCGVYLIDALFITDASKFIAGNLAALAAMMHLELPHLNVRFCRCLRCRGCTKPIAVQCARHPGGAASSYFGARHSFRCSNLPLCYVQVLTKCDLVKGDILDRYLSPSGADMVSELSRSTSTRYKRLNAALASLVRCDACHSASVRACGVGERKM